MRVMHTPNDKSSLVSPRARNLVQHCENILQALNDTQPAALTAILAIQSCGEVFDVNTASACAVSLIDLH